MITRCLTDQVVFQLVQGRLSREQLAGVEQHLTECPDCSAMVAETAKFVFPESGEPRSFAAESLADEVSGDVHQPQRARRKPLPPGFTVSRYVLGELLGIGGGGTVYRAFDPQLRRNVALKLVRQSAESPDEQESALREARAIARLAHPNIVNVHDAGIFAGQVYIVMELVEGITLTEWLRREERSVRDVLTVFLEAGRGLAAAHAADLVHRDFKPDNVLIGSDGRVRVTDFGLARPAAERPSNPRRSSGLAGTPLFMAPEQLQGRDADFRTDQFNFCVALHVSLYARHPFSTAGPEDRNVKRLMADVIAGKLALDRKMPPWLRTVLLRGLALDPSGRFPAMDELLLQISRELDRGRAKIRRGTWLAMIASSFFVAGLAAVLVSKRSVVEQRCGNGKLDPGEECDDGNRQNDDQCTAMCLACRPGPSEIVGVGDGCFTFHESPETWARAREICIAKGGDLISYRTHHKMEEVSRSFLERRRGQPIWIGLSASTGAGVFGWVTNELLENENEEWRGYHPWAKGPPVVGRPACVAQLLAIGERGAGWATFDCNERRPFVCERTPWLVRAPGGHAYHAFSELLPWAEARARCAKLGGHLLTISDADEQEFATGLLTSQCVWIGASERESSVFHWATGEPFEYHKFHAGEPDHYHPGQQCVCLGIDKTWHDRPCDKRYPYVCEVE